jgi:hypothetical protein
MAPGSGYVYDPNAVNWKCIDKDYDPVKTGLVAQQMRELVNKSRRQLNLPDLFRDPGNDQPAPPDPGVSSYDALVGAVVIIAGGIFIYFVFKRK